MGASGGQNPGAVTAVVVVVAGLWLLLATATPVPTITKRTDVMIA